MTECPSCGAKVAETDDSCEICGLRLSGATESFAPVSVPESQSPIDVERAEGLVLVVQKGPEVGERFYVDRPELTVGRDPERDIFLNDVTVSRRHAVLRLGEGVVSVEDRGSLNGTYVNGVRVDAAVLKSGDILQIGTFQMLFLAGGGER